MEILLKDGVKFIEFCFKTESDFEKVVFNQYKELFGNNAILFTKQKILTSTKIVGIPDAFIIDLKTEKWAIIEVELSTHDVYRHIIPQISKFATAIDNPETIKTLVEFFDSTIKNDPYKKILFQVNKKDEIFRTINKILSNNPELIIIVDRRHKELESALKSLPYNSKVINFRVFSRENSNLIDNIFLFEPLYNFEIENKIEETTIIIDKSKSKDNIKKDEKRILEKLNTYSGEIQHNFNIVDKFIKSFNNIETKENRNMITYSFGKSSKGNSVLWIEPSKNYLKFYFAKGDYLEILKKGLGGYPILNIEKNDFANSLDKLKKYIEISYNKIVNKS